MLVPRATLTELCKRFGAMLRLPAGIDGAQLLWALSGNESSFGANCAPRHEPAYCHGGKYFDALLTRSWGCLAHCSYGPWQVLYANTNPGMNPLTFAQTPELVAGAAASLIQRRILQAEKATTLEEIAEAYNAGDWRDRSMPTQYTADLVKNYAVPLG
jgi:hypothetical protein